MNNCVRSRAQDCLDGNARIFSHRQESHPKVTAEIVLRRNTWTPGQTKRYKNAPPSARETAITRQTAREYQQIRDNTPGPKHTGWTEDQK